MVPLLDGKSPQELATVIHSECAARSTTFSSLMEYRLNALRCLWASLRKPDKKDTTSPKKGEESADSQSKQNQQHSEQFCLSISLLLYHYIDRETVTTHYIREIDLHSYCESNQSRGSNL